MEERKAKIMERYGKLKVSLYYYLLGRNYTTAMKAYNYAAKWHQGLRKDNATPEFQHQIEIALYLSTLKGVVNEERVLTLAMLHDLLEDCPDVTQEDLEKEFGGSIAQDCEYLNKKEKSTDMYFRWISTGIDISLVKGADRVHNMNSMKGVFSIAKQKEYVEEVEKYFLPMLKHARKVHPEQLQAYTSIEFVLRSQINLLRGE